MYAPRPQVASLVTALAEAGALNVEVASAAAAWLTTHDWRLQRAPVDKVLHMLSALHSAGQLDQAALGSCVAQLLDLHEAAMQLRQQRQQQWEQLQEGQQQVGQQGQEQQRQEQLQQQDAAGSPAPARPRPQQGVQRLWPEQLQALQDLVAHSGNEGLAQRVAQAADAAARASESA